MSKGLLATIGHGVTRALKLVSRVVGVLLLTVFIFLVVFGVGFFATPEFHLPTAQIRQLIDKYAPENLQLEFDKLDIALVRPSGLPFAKRLSIDAGSVCLRYEGEAVNACFKEISLAATAGWGGERLEGEAWYMPRLVAIAPIRMTGGDVLVDLPKFPPEEQKKEDEGSFDIVGLLRRQILPKWELEGSLIELQPLKIITEAGQGYFARFDLTTGEEGDTLRAKLKEFRALGGPLRAQASIRITSPADWINSPTPRGQPETKEAWKLWAEGEVQLDRKREVSLKADSSIYDWQTLDFRIGTKWRGIAALRELRLDGALAEHKLDSRFSLKMGSPSAQVRALDFANCGLSADLDQKIAGLRCGPQTVRLQMTEKSLIRDPKFFILNPEFDLRATRIAFGETKEVDFSLDLKLKHHDFFNVVTQATGEVRKGPGEDPLKYGIRGQFDFAIDKLQRVVRLFRRTPFEVPAPLNVLDGKVNVSAAVDVTDQGGSVKYQTATALDSQFQAVYLRLQGDTNLRQVAGSLVPATQIDLAIDRLYLSAPRFDLRIPPQFIPDSRFGPIDRAAMQDPPKLEKAKKSEPMDLKFRIRTTAPKSIQIATNLTKAAIPISLDVTYDEKSGIVYPEDLPPPPSRGPASINKEISRPGSGANLRTANKAPKAPAVTGWVSVGQVPIELFRREATVQEVRVDLTPSGTQRLNGLVQLNYLDYDINVLLLGTTAQPTVKLTSDPPLADQDIMGVLLFGRGPNELDDDQRDSAANARAAFANATLGLSSLYLLASTPIESVGYDAERDLVTAKVGLGGGASVELGGNAEASAVGFRKRLTREFVFRSDVETIGSSGKRTISALIEWVKRF